MSQKRGQVTIFIIIAILIVSAVLVYTLWLGPTLNFRDGGSVGFDGCVEDAVSQAIMDLGPTGGFDRPTFVYNHQGYVYPYLCYTAEYYQLCTVQKAFLKQHFEGEMESVLRDSIEACYLASLDDLESQGFDVVRGDVTYEVILEPGFARVEIEAPTSIRSGESGNRFTRFNVRVNSGIYEMLGIATSILQYESQLGDSDTTSLMVLYPEVVIDKLKQSDGTTLYTLEHKLYGNQFKFASRSIAWPAGYDITLP